MSCFSKPWASLKIFLRLIIGLFGVVGMAGVTMGPVAGHIIDRLIPWYASLVGVMMLVLLQSVQLGAGGIHIAAVIVSTFGLDVFRQMLQVSLTTAIFGYGFRHLSHFTLRSYFPPKNLNLSESKAQCGVNPMRKKYMFLDKSWFKQFFLQNFIGQVIGTSVGTHIFINFGWRAGAALSMGFYAWATFLLLIRGPHCKRYTWFGYEGGLEARKVAAERGRLEEEKEREITSSFPLNGGKDTAATSMTGISEKTENDILV